MDFFTRFIIAFIVIFFSIMVGLHVPIVMFMLLAAVAAFIIGYAMEVLDNL